MRNIQKNQHQAIFVIILITYSAIVLFVFFFFIDPSLKGESAWRWTADTPTYMDLAKGTHNQDLELIGLSGNTIGPILISRLLNNNTFLIVIFNYIVFVISCFLLSLNSNVSKVKMLLLIIMSPMLLVSIGSLSKEILGFLDISLTLFICRTTKNYYGIAIALLIGILVRWQMAVFVLLSVTLCRVVPQTEKARWNGLLGLLLIISLFYPLISRTIDLDTALSTEALKTTVESNSGFNYFLNDLQSNYMMFLAVIPKSLMNIIYSPLAFLEIDHSRLFLSKNSYVDIFNDYVAFLQGIVSIPILFLIGKNSSISIMKNSQFLIAIYCIIFSLSPFIQTRYFFPIYPLLCLEAAFSSKEKS
jgi:hypothetical protein